MQKSQYRLLRYIIIVIIVNIIVILWGAFVRASGSGAGCGSHWPLCNGAVIPPAPQLETLIEFTHRLTSGVAFLLVVGLLIMAFREYPGGHRVRKSALFVLFFMISEALVGAGLVLFEWVAEDASLGRVISIPIHLLNTFLLLASMVLTAWWVYGGRELSLRKNLTLSSVAIIGLLGVLVIGMTGAITALGDTLFPSESLAAGIRQDFSPTAHYLVRLRVWHPVIAFLIGFYWVFVGGFLALIHGEPRYRLSEDPVIRNRSRFLRFLSLSLIGFVILQWIAGLLNVWLLAPVWMQLVHLFIAVAIWIQAVLVSIILLEQKSADAIDENSDLISQG